ncbi:uncharacterized protein LOC133703585 [Populus nigra]|uniref:uncharacterized protein LOC133703585 n=1 Tax=Populus nigra TaxID=3691 RepID=UPI002B2666FF|nr:uncharacterized protein LOC133703585 [Populus nigra]
MLKTLLEIPSNLVGLDVSYCYSLQRIANLIPFTIARDCDQLVHIQDWIKLELIQKVDPHLLRIMEMVSVQMQTWRFQIELHGNRFSFVLEYDENEMLEFYEEEGLIQKEFEEHLSFKISSPATHRICGFNLFTWFSATLVPNPYLHVYLEIRNNTKGRVWVFYPSIFPIEFSAEKSELLWLRYWKIGSNDPVFDTGDEFSVSVFTDDPVVQIKRVGVRMLHEEEGTDDDSSSSNTSDDIFRNYYCSDRYDFDNEIIICFLEKKLNALNKLVLLLAYLQVYLKQPLAFHVSPSWSLYHKSSFETLHPLLQESSHRCFLLCNQGARIPERKFCRAYGEGQEVKIASGLQSTMMSA